MAIKLRPSEEPTINLTSMIDVLFLLIIFFMVASKFKSDEHSIAIQLPTAKASASMIAAPAPKVVTLALDGRIILDGHEVTATQLTQHLRAAVANYPELAVDVRSDGQGQIQQLTQVCSAVAAAGVTKLGLRTTSDAAHTLQR